MGGNPQKRKYTQFGHLNFLLDISTWTIEHGGVLLSALDLMTDLGFDNVLWNEKFLACYEKGHFCRIEGSCVKLWLPRTWAHFLLGTSLGRWGHAPHKMLNLDVLRLHLVTSETQHKYTHAIYHKSHTGSLKFDLHICGCSFPGWDSARQS